MNKKSLVRKAQLFSLLVILAVPAFRSPPPAGAQVTPPSPAIDTNSIPQSTGSFFTSVKDYFTSFNTNLDSTFATERGSAFVGVDAMQGGKVPLANSIGLSYDLWKAVSADVVIRDGGVAGTIISEQGGLGLNFIVHDAKLTVYLDGGYDNSVEAIVNAKGKKVQPDRLFGELGIRVQKALTTHTFAGVGMGVQFPSEIRIFSAFAGFTF